jgi:hypothetical protein
LQADLGTQHVLGSQVFDYWFDTSKFMVVRPLNYENIRMVSNICALQEHYADGDLVNSETKVAHVPAGPQALSVWGPPVPSVF